MQVWVTFATEIGYRNKENLQNVYEEILNLENYMNDTKLRLISTLNIEAFSDIDLESMSRHIYLLTVLLFQHRNNIMRPSIEFLIMKFKDWAHHTEKENLQSEQLDKDNRLKQSRSVLEMMDHDIDFIKTSEIEALFTELKTFALLTIEKYQRIPSMKAKGNTDINQTDRQLADITDRYKNSYTNNVY